MGDDAMSRSPVVAEIGLGEAGAAIARDLVHAGCEVRGWDPAPRGDVRDVPRAASAHEAVAGAGVILSVNVAAVARAVAQELLPALGAGQLYADLNTAAPALKRELAALVEPAGARFVDLALMAPVPGRGVRTPSLASGSGARAFVELFKPLDMPVSFVDEQPGCAAWMHEEIARQLASADEALLDRLVEGSRKHALRRTEEMQAAAELLRA